ncbi:MAG TPA: hypothetical protein VJJ78_04625 [Candidatus Saccharimonadales bacterium]|nr:hypothetical protein [Candidatus Saccharimonadales bacterium]
MTGEYVSPRQARSKRQAVNKLKRESETRIAAKREQQRVEVVGHLWELFEEIKSNEFPNTEFPRVEKIEIVKRAGKIAHLLHPYSVVDTDELENFDQHRLNYRVLKTVNGYRIHPVQFIARSNQPAPTTEALLLETGHVATKVTADSRAKNHKGGGQYSYGDMQPHNRNAIAVFKNDLIPMLDIESPELYIGTFEKLATELGIAVTRTEAYVDPVTEIGS